MSALAGSQLNKVHKAVSTIGLLVNYCPCQLKNNTFCNYAKFSFLLDSNSSSFYLFTSYFLLSRSISSLLITPDHKWTVASNLLAYKNADFSIICNMSQNWRQKHLSYKSSSMCILLTINYSWLMLSKNKEQEACQKLAS